MAVHEAPQRSRAALLWAVAGSAGLLALAGVLSDKGGVAGPKASGMLSRATAGMTSQLSKRFQARRPQELETTNKGDGFEWAPFSNTDTFNPSWFPDITKNATNSTLSPPPTPLLTAPPPPPATTPTPTPPTVTHPPPPSPTVTTLPPPTTTSPPPVASLAHSVCGQPPNLLPLHPSTPPPQTPNPKPETRNTKPHRRALRGPRTSCRDLRWYSSTIHPQP